MTYRLEIGCSIQLSYRCANSYRTSKNPLIPRSLMIPHLGNHFNVSNESCQSMELAFYGRFIE